MSKVFIAFPVYQRQVDVETLISFGRLITETHNEYGVDFMSGSIITSARNYLVGKFLKSGFEWLYFWDSDIVIKDISFIDKLLETAQKLDAKIVGAPYRMKNNDNEYVAGNIVYGPDQAIIVRKKVGELEEPLYVDCIGTGSMLIHRSVFEVLPEPWFTIIDQKDGDVMPEDYNFCLNAKRKGIVTALDPRISTFHFGLSAWPHMYKGAVPVL